MTTQIELCTHNSLHPTVMSLNSLIRRFYLCTRVYNPGDSGLAQTPPHDTTPYKIGSF